MIRFEAVTEVNLDKPEPKRAARKSNNPFEIDKVCPIVRTGNSAHLAVRLIRTVRGVSEPSDFIASVFAGENITAWSELLY